MGFDEYQEKGAEFDLFEASDDLKTTGFVAKVFGLAGETGEVSEKFKKILRDKNGELGDGDKEEISKELGDVLWYVAAIARYMGVSLEEVARGNIDKLQSRLQRGKIRGSGDDR